MANMHIFYVLFIVFVTFEVSNAVYEQDVTRKIHGSYGAFRDFTREDCDRPHQNNWMRCSGQENPAFVYHWNNQLQGCERAIFKGCGATRNNFLSERDCNNQAKPICSNNRKVPRY